MIEIRELSKSYGTKQALRPISHRFSTGATTALIGPSGCGKSTLLRLMMGLIVPSDGSVLIGGQPVSDWQAARRKIGYVVQDGGLFPHLTASQNATVMARHLGTPADKIRSKTEELCALTNFPSEGLDSFPAELSGGQRQRVSLMRALMLEPQALLLDEPLGALDPMVRSRLQSDLKAIFERLNQTVIFVTHDLAEAAFLSTEIILLNEGSVVQKGTLGDLRDHPSTEFVTEFMNAQRSLVSL